MVAQQRSGIAFNETTFAVAAGRVIDSEPEEGHPVDVLANQWLGYRGIVYRADRSRSEHSLLTQCLIHSSAKSRLPVVFAMIREATL